MAVLRDYEVSFHIDDVGMIVATVEDRYDSYRRFLVELPSGSIYGRDGYTEAEASLICDNMITEIVRNMESRYEAACVKMTS